MSEVKQRLLEFIKYLGIKKNAFEQTVGMSNGFVNNTNDRITKRSLDSIQSAYPQLNIDWLINGRGEMINEENTQKVYLDAPKFSPEISALLNRVDRLLELQEKNTAIHEQNAKNMDRLISLFIERSSVSEIKEKSVV